MAANVLLIIFAPLTIFRGAEQNKIISSTEGAIKIKKEMVKYTEEKARHSDNLLKLYGFLNIVVVGLLVYIYKASSE